MIQILSNLNASDVIPFATEEFSLTFVEDSDYEFVGGGNAVNGF